MTAVALEHSTVIRNYGLLYKVRPKYLTSKIYSLFLFLSHLLLACTMCMCLMLCVYEYRCMPATAHTWWGGGVQRTTCGVSSFLSSCRVWNSNSDCQPWWQEPLPTKPCHHLLLVYFVYVCARVHVCERKCACALEYARTHVETRGFFLNHFLTLVLGRGLSLNLELNDSVMLTGQPAQGILLPQQPQQRAYRRHCWSVFLLWEPRFQNRIHIGYMASTLSSEPFSRPLQFK